MKNNNNLKRNFKIRNKFKIIKFSIKSTVNQILKLRNLVRARNSKMFSLLKDRTFKSLRFFIPRLITLNMNRLRGSPGRIRIALNFISWIAKMTKNHGAVHTVKWLKASTTALQKWLGDDHLKSLRLIESNLPLPRLINGCPAIINRRDRHQMRQGNIYVIRFWHSLLSLYRIIEIPGKLKLNTIFDPFSGSELFLSELVFHANSVFLWPSHLERVAREQFGLIPTKMHPSSGASPVCSFSAEGWLTDIDNIFNLDVSAREGFHCERPFNKWRAEHESRREEVRNNLLKFLHVIEPRGSTFIHEVINPALKIISDLREEGISAFPEKCTAPKTCFGQLSVKYEAAGKIRVFALFDSVSQAVLRPLHDKLADVLKTIPNDGTFHQDETVLLGMQKAQESGCAYSFDLSAATDRLPSSLSAAVMSSLFGLPDLGPAWQALMNGRDFSFSDKIAEKLGLPEGTVVRYAVGQGMGAHTSFPILGLTHHWIIQKIALDLGLIRPGEWYEGYIVLGDDIVIFDEMVAKQYVLYMTTLGLEINFAKSLISKHKPVFEFAKRTVIGNNIVSGVNLKQVISGTTLSLRTAFAFQWIELGYVTNYSVLISILNNWREKSNDFVTSVGLFSLLNLYSKDVGNGILCLVNPDRGGSWSLKESSSLKVPVRAMTDHILNMEERMLNKAEYRIWRSIDVQYKLIELYIKRMRKYIETIYGDTKQKASIDYWSKMLIASESIYNQVPDENGKNKNREYSSDLMDRLHEWTEFQIQPIISLKGWMMDPAVDVDTEIVDDMEKRNGPFSDRITLDEVIKFHDELFLKSLKFDFPQKGEKSDVVLDRLDMGIIKDLVTALKNDSAINWGKVYKSEWIDDSTLLNLFNKDMGSNNMLSSSDELVIEI